MNSRKQSALVAGLLGVVMSLAAVGPVAAATPIEPEQIAGAVADAVDVAAPGSAEPLPVAVSSEGFVAGDGSTSIIAPETSGEDVEITGSAGEADTRVSIAFSLPEEVTSDDPARAASDGTVTYEGGSADVAVQALPGGVRLSTILNEASAPTKYTYGLPEGVEAVLNEDGSAVLQAAFSDASEDGEVYEATVVLGSLHKPWAIDANGVAVPTHYVAVPGGIVQVVEHDGDVAYPVVADPSFWWGWNIYVSTSVVAQIVKLLLLGAAAATVAASVVRLVPGITAFVGNAIGLAGALLAFGAAALNACNIRNRGVYLGQTWVAGFLPPFPGLLAFRGGHFCVPN